MAISKKERREKIKLRIKHKVLGTPEKPRMSVFKSNKHIRVQLIDDVNARTLASASSMIDQVNNVNGNKTAKSKEVGKIIAKNAISAGIKEARFDRGGYLYHGRVKALAEGAREGGLKI